MSFTGHRLKLLLAFCLAALVIGAASAPVEGAPGPTGDPSTSATGASASATGLPHRFKGTSSRIDRKTKAKMTGLSWHKGCPVGFLDLRLLKLRYWGFDGDVHPGKLVVNADSDRTILRVMRDLFKLHFAFRRMHLVDAYGADDHRSMAADNTSAFNCRFVSGSSNWSEHAYGHAIDINTIENPYVTPGGYVSPPAGRPYASRHPHRKGMINAGGRVVAAFADVGWGWGGSWSGTKDFQHFSSSGH